jgi:ParB family chromosome partitioning protein
MEHQPRKTFNPERLLRLSDSIKEVGQIMPGYVRRIDRDIDDHDRELIDGERRWRAILMAEIRRYRAMLIECDDEAAQYIVSIIANFNREGHTPLEIADSIRVMHEQLKIPIEEVAKSMGFHPVYATNLYGLRRLAQQVREMLDPELDRNRQLPVTAAIELSRLPAEMQLPLALRVLSREVSLRGLRNEVVSVSKKNNIPVQKRRTNIADQRRVVERKATIIRRDVEELKVRVVEDRFAVVRGWSEGAKKAFRTEIASARVELGKILEVIPT